MKRLLIACMLAGAFFFSIQSTCAQRAPVISGAWQGEAGQGHAVLLLQDGYLSYSVYSGDSFKYTLGGPYQQNGGALSVEVEFDSRSDQNDSNPVLSLSIPIEQQNGNLKLSLQGEELNLARIDQGQAPLAGVWQITDRMQEGEIVPIQRTGTRKTLKMLTGTRFQWFAIDPATRLFAGTGGGTYTFQDGKYVENIEFFSRDDSRVGSSLSFDGRLEDGKWHHSGLSSTGNEIYEVWGRSHR